MADLVCILLAGTLRSLASGPTQEGYNIAIIIGSYQACHSCMMNDREVISQMYSVPTHSVQVAIAGRT